MESDDAVSDNVLPKLREIGHVNVSFDPELLNHHPNQSMTTVLNLRSRMNLTTSVLSEDIYTLWLDQTFGDLFDEYDDGMPTEKLVELLRNDSYSLPRKRLNRFMLKLDSNKDGKVTYDEFREFMLNIEPRDRSFIKQILIKLALKSSPDLIESYLPGESQSNNNAVETERHKLKHELAESYIDAYNCHPPPLFIPFIVVLQITIFIYYGLQIIQENRPLTLTSGLPKHNLLIFDPKRRKEVWRYITYMLIHQGYLHVVLNCFIQLIIGIPLEMVHKFWRVGPVFIAGVLFGSLASSIIDMNSILVGSSGGAYALVGAHFAIVIINWDELQRDWLNFKSQDGVLNFVTSGVVRLVFLLTFLTVDISATLYRRFGLDIDSQTSSAAHFGGFIAGLLIGIPCLRNIRRKLWEIKLFWISLIVYTFLLVFAILWNIFKSGYVTG